MLLGWLGLRGKQAARALDWAERGVRGEVRGWAEVPSWMVLGQQAESAGEFFPFFFFSLFYFFSKHFLKELLSIK